MARQGNAGRAGAAAMSAPCPFCHPARVLAAQGQALAVPDANPVTPGHTLIVPRRHAADFTALTPRELAEIWALAARMRQDLARQDPTIAGWNLGVNVGAVAGQTVWHAHLHLIPRRKGDTPEPRGGVRGVIPGKRFYSPSD